MDLAAIDMKDEKIKFCGADNLIFFSSNTDEAIKTTKICLILTMHLQQDNVEKEQTRLETTLQS